jgi:hypothetical protein
MLLASRRIIPLCFALLLQACPGGGNGGTDGGSNGGIATVSLSPASASITVGAKKQFYATALDSSGKPVSAAFTWTSSMPAVATVDGAGLATAVGQGTTNITAKTGSVFGAAQLGVAAPLKPLVLKTKTLPPATAGAPYSVALEASGNGPLTYSASTIAQGNNGLSLTGATISGSPLYSGPQPIFVTVGDGTSTIGVELELPIGGAGGAQQLTNAPSPATQGSAYDFTVATSWGLGGCLVGLTRAMGSLPPGLGYNNLDGHFTGTPTVAGRFPVVFYANAGSSACASTPTNLATLLFDVAPAAAPATPPGSSGFVRGSPQPVVKPSASGWDGFTLRSPAALFNGGTYFLYYEGADSTDFHDSIGLATSPDGVTFTPAGAPVVAASASSPSWMSRDARAPMVLHDATGFRMWFFGGDGAGTQLGHATSSDGRAWTVSPAACTIQSGSAPLFGFGTGAIVSDGSKLVWFYGSGGSIGRATSTDGLAWSDQGMVLTPSTAGNPLSFATPAAIYESGTYRLWYTVAESLGGGAGNPSSVYAVRIGHATSSDGVTWTTLGSDFAPGAAGAWDRPAVGHASVVHDGSGYLLFYAGGRAVMDGADADVGYFVEGAIGVARAP